MDFMDKKKTEEFLVLKEIGEFMVKRGRAQVV